MAASQSELTPISARKSGADQRPGGRSFESDWRAIAMIENSLIAALVVIVLVLTMTGASARLTGLSFVAPPAPYVSH